MPTTTLISLFGHFCVSILFRHHLHLLCTIPWIQFLLLLIGDVCMYLLDIMWGMTECMHIYIYIYVGSGKMNSQVLDINKKTKNTIQNFICFVIVTILFYRLYSPKAYPHKLYPPEASPWSSCSILHFIASGMT